MIEFSQVTKLYKNVIGVNDVSIKLDGGAYGLLGPNGSGKTTFINLVMGQLRPTIGTVSVFGRDPTKDDSILTKIGLCPAVEPTYPFLTGFDWVRYLTKLHGLPANEADEKAEAALDQVGMSEKMHLNMGSYSLGMRQRCKLAQAIAHDPELLILDEPFNGLDPVGRIEMTDYLRKWVTKGKSIILASHVLHEVEAIEPSFLLVSGGRLLASGSPEEVRQLMTHCPNEFEIVCDEYRLLTDKLLQNVDIDKVDFDTAKNSVSLSTRFPNEFCAKLAEIAMENQITVRQLNSSDDSLQELFTNLMKMHRGEI